MAGLEFPAASKRQDWPDIHRHDSTSLGLKTDIELALSDSAELPVGA